MLHNGIVVRREGGCLGCKVAHPLADPLDHSDWQGLSRLIPLLAFLSNWGMRRHFSKKKAPAVNRGLRIAPCRSDGDQAARPYCAE